MKHIAHFVSHNRKRILSLLLVLVTFISVNVDGITAFAKEINDTVRVFSGEPKSFNPFDYAVFSSGNDEFIINAGSLSVDGDVHSNAGFVYRGNEIAVKGVLETTDTALISVSDKDYKKKIGEIKEYVNPVSAPSIVKDIKDEIRDDAIVYSGYTAFQSTVLNQKAIVNGDVYISCKEFSGDSIIVSSGSIQMGVDRLKSNDGALFLCSENGNIQINASNTTMNGIIYAPNGTVMITGDTFNLNGRIIAKKIVFYGSKLNVKSSESDLSVLDCLSGETPKLIISGDIKGYANHTINMSLSENIFLSDVDEDKIDLKVLDENLKKLKETKDYYVIKESNPYEYKLVFVNPGEYTLKYSVSYHLKNISSEVKVTIKEDLGIEGSLLTDSYVYRESDGKAQINITDMSVSLDGDEIGNRTIVIDFDGDGDGIYETEVLSDELQGNTYTFATDKVGKYRVSVSNNELLSKDVANVYGKTFVNEGMASEIIEVGNKAPSVKAQIKLAREPYILVLFDDESESEIVKLLNDTKDGLKNLGIISETEFVKLADFGDAKTVAEIKSALENVNSDIGNVYIINLCDLANELSTQGYVDALTQMYESGAYLYTPGRQVISDELVKVIYESKNEDILLTGLIKNQKIVYECSFVDEEGDKLSNLNYEYKFRNFDGINEEIKVTQEAITSFDKAGLYDISVKALDSPSGDASYSNWSENFEVAKDLVVLDERSKIDVSCNIISEGNGKYHADFVNNSKKDVDYKYLKIGDEEFVYGPLPDSLNSKDRYLVVAYGRDSYGIDCIPQVFDVHDNTDNNEDDKINVTGEIIKEDYIATGLLISSDSALSRDVEEVLKELGDVYSKNYYTSPLDDYKNHRYEVSDEMCTWEEAKIACERAGGHLVTISSLEENEYVKNIINSDGKSTYTAIGYSDEETEGEWAWVNGEISRFEYWNSGEPNNGLWHGEQDHAYMYEDGTWDDGFYGEEHYYVCEWEDTQEAIEIETVELIDKTAGNKLLVTDIFENESVPSEVKAIWEKAAIETGAKVVSLSEFNKENITWGKQETNGEFVVGDKLVCNLSGVPEGAKVTYEVSYVSFDGSESENIIIDSWQNLTKSGSVTVKAKIWGEAGVVLAETYIAKDLCIYERPSISFEYTKEPVRNIDNQDECEVCVKYSVTSSNGLGDETTPESIISYKEIEDSDWTIGNLPERLPVDKVYLVKGTAVDTLGIESFPSVFIVSTKNLEIIDNNGPDITLELSKTKVGVGEEVTITSGASDISGVGSFMLMADGELLSYKEGRFYYTPTCEGERVIVAHAKDTKGNETSKSVILSVTKVTEEDNEPPTVIINSVNTNDNGEIEVRGSVYDEKALAHYELLIKKEGSEYSKTISNGNKECRDAILGKVKTADLDDGNYVLILSATDMAGNENSTNVSVSLGVLGINIESISLSEDQKTILVYGNLGCANELSSVTYELKDDSGNALGVDSSSKAGVLCLIPTEGLKTGTYKLVITATDSLGNSSSSEALIEYTEGEMGDGETYVGEKFVPFKWESLECKNENSELNIIGKLGNNEYEYSLSKEGGEDIAFTYTENEGKVILCVDANTLEDGLYIVKASVKGKEGLNAVMKFSFVAGSNSGEEEITVSLDDTKISPVITDICLNENKDKVLILGEKGTEDESTLLDVKCTNKENGEEIPVTYSENDGVLAEIEISSLRGGEYEVIVTVTEKSGNSGGYIQNFEFKEGSRILPGITTGESTEYDADDTNPPTANIRLDVEGKYIDKETDIYATALDDKGVRSYAVEYRCKGTDEFFELCSDTKDVDDIKVCTFNPDTLSNGVYEFRITVTDNGGNTASATREYTVNQALKIGAMSVGFEDLTRRIGSTTLHVNRVYRSFNKNVGDYGYGWSGDITGMSLTLLGDLTYGYSQETTGSGLGTIFNISETSNHDILLNVGDGTTQVFKLDLSPKEQSIKPITDVKVGFICKESSDYKLELIGDNSAEYIDGNLYFTDENALDGFCITDGEGCKYYFGADGKETSIECSDGTTFTVSDNGILASDGTGVSFVRDEIGRITSASDGLGREVYYTYDEDGNLQRFTDYNGNVVTYEYDKYHNLTAIKDSDGMIVARQEYDENGRLIASVDALGNRTEYSYDLYTKVQVIKDANGNPTTYYYDDAGLVLKEVDALGNEISYTYDDNHNLTSKTDPNGKVITYEYDKDGNLISSTLEGGYKSCLTVNESGFVTSVSVMDIIVSNLSYDLKGNVTSITDANGNETTYSYDSNGNNTLISDSLGTVISAVYNENGQTTSVRDASGLLITYSYNENGECSAITAHDGDKTYTMSLVYDAHGRVAVSTDAAGRSIHYEYDTRGNITLQTDDDGNKTEYAYDLAGNLIYVVYPSGETENFEYDALGNVTKITDASGLSESFLYDKVGNLIRITYPDGLSENYTYDALGNILTASDVYGVVTTYEYDDLYRNIKTSNPIYGDTTYTYDYFSRPLTITDATGSVYTYEYDGNGNLLKETMPDGNSYSYSYDARDRLTKTYDGYGNEATYTYDNADNLTSVTDASGNKTSYAYDVFGNLCEVTDANGNKTTYNYDGASELTSLTNALGRSAFYERDSLGRVSKYTDFAGNVTEYTYDSCGRLLLTLDDVGLISYSYDKGLLTKVSSGEKSKTYTYDALGYVTSTEDENGNVLNYSYDAYGNVTKIEGVGYSVSYAYDEYGRLTSSTDANGVKVSYAYDEVSRVKSETYSNGIIKTYTYDNCGRVSSETYVNSKGKTLFSYEYTFGKNGELTAAFETSSGAVTNISYDYDLTGFITKESYTQGENSYVSEYTYDGSGNRTSKNVTVTGDVSKFITEAINIGLTTYEYNALNQLVKESFDGTDTTYIYDDAGNLIQTSGASNAAYTYNTRNELVSAKVTTGAGVKEEQYTLDVEGIRCGKKTAYADIEYVTYSIGGISTLFAVKENGTLKATYQRAFGLVSETVDGESYIYVVDALENVRALIDEDENVTDTFDYDSYGVNLSKIENTYNPYGYKCEETDELTGFVYLRARYYNPANGRFISEDTYGGNIGNPVTLNRYAYANNNPVSYADPSGHAGTLIGCMCTLAMQSIAENYNQILISGYMGSLFAVADAALDKNQDGKDYAEIAIKGFVSGMAFGMLFAGLGGIGEVFATVKYLTMLFSGIMIDAGFFFAGVSIGEGNYEQGAFRFLTSAWAMHSWGKAYASQENAITDAAKEEIKTSYGKSSTNFTEGGKGSNEFFIDDWSGYPEELPKPEGPFRILEGEEYNTARNLANKTNANIHKSRPDLKGTQIHEIHPVKFGGSPTDIDNKIALSPKEHARYTAFWNKVLRNMKNGGN